MGSSAKYKLRCAPVLAAGQGSGGFWKVPEVPVQMVDEGSGGSARFRKIPGSSGADASQGSAGGARGEGAAPPRKENNQLQPRRGASRASERLRSLRCHARAFRSKKLLLPMYNGAPIALWLSLLFSARHMFYFKCLQTRMLFWLLGSSFFPPSCA